MKKWMFVALLSVFLTAPLSAAGFQLHGAYWDSDQAGEALGIGVAVAWDTTEVLGIELRSAYMEGMKTEAFDGIIGDFPDLDDVLDGDLAVSPIELGLRFDFNRDAESFAPYISGGIGYYLLSSNFGDVDNEVGFYAAVGSAFGDGNGADFFVELTYRVIEASLKSPSNLFDDLDGVQFDNDLAFDLNGPGANIGVVWRW